MSIEVIICPNCNKKYSVSDCPKDCDCRSALDEIESIWVEEPSAISSADQQTGKTEMVECTACDITYDSKLHSKCPSCLPVVVNLTVREPIRPVFCFVWPWSERETITDSFFIGREAPASARLAARLENNYDNVSRKHAELFWKDNQWCVRDFNSTNGTFVNGERILPQQVVSLSNGTKLRFAATLEVVVQIGEDECA